MTKFTKRILIFSSISILLTTIFLVAILSHLTQNCLDHEESTSLWCSIDKSLKNTIDYIVLSKRERLSNRLSKKLLKNLTIEEKVGQMLMVAVPGKKATRLNRSIIQNYKTGGIILFGYNMSPQLKQFINDLQGTAKRAIKIPLFISTDQEGGRVKRIVTGVTQFPGNMAIGAAYDTTLTYKAARILGIELRNIGINMNLAPVVDINNNPDNPVINTRSFGSNPKIVATLGKSYINGLQDSRCMAVAKHFPGHGDTNKDSHKTLPVINYDMKRLNKIELFPFREAISARVSSIMTAHISYPKILQSDNPATISKIFLTDLLRSKFGFKGLVITDDLEMNAISKTMTIEKAVIQSIKAGTDILLISSYRKKIPRMYAAILAAIKKKKLSVERINKSVKRILFYKYYYGIIKTTSIEIQNNEIKKLETQLLKQADIVNKQLTKRSIYYYGKDKDIFKKKNPSIYITHSSFFRKKLLHNKKRVFTKITRAFQFIGHNKHKKFRVYLHVNNPSYYNIEQIHNRCVQRKCSLFIISTGNPFPLFKLKKIKHILVSFSNTDESINQLTNIVCGKTKPKSKTNIALK